MLHDSHRGSKRASLSSLKPISPPPVPPACKCLAELLNICPALAASSRTPTTSIYSATCKLEKSCSHSVSANQIKPQPFGSPESATIKLRQGLYFVQSSSVRLPGYPARLLTPHRLSIQDPVWLQTTLLPFLNHFPFFLPVHQTFHPRSL